VLFVLRIVTLPVRLITKGGFRLGRRLGLSRLALLGAGVAAGLMVAREPGRDLRKRFAERVREVQAQRAAPASEEELLARVRDALSQAPRTWHLPQPDIEVVAGTVILSGSAPHAAGRADIEQVVVAVAGVEHVDNRLVVTSR
jgi:osmotically-inducible protein OsmY